MKDFSCTRAEDMEPSPLSIRVHQLKNSKGGQDEMCKIMEDLCKEASQEALLNSFCDLVRRNRLPISEAVEESGLSENEFREAMRTRYPDWHG